METKPAWPKSSVSSLLLRPEIGALTDNRWSRTVGRTGQQIQDEPERHEAAVWLQLFKRLVFQQEHARHAESRQSNRPPPRPSRPTLNL